MSGWLGKIFGHNVAKKLSQQVSQAKVVNKIAPQVEAKVETAVVQSVKQNGPSLGNMISYGKWYYGVDTNAKPTVKKVGNLIERKYPCKDGEELVVSYVNNPGVESRLSIAKTRSDSDIGRSGWYKSFYSDTITKHSQNKYGDNITKTVKKKGAIKQTLSTKNGRYTDDVHVPLKRWELTKGDIGNNKKIDSTINSWNPDDFKRFVD